MPPTNPPPHAAQAEEKSLYEQVCDAHVDRVGHLSASLARQEIRLIEARFLANNEINQLRARITELEAAPGTESIAVHDDAGREVATWGLDANDED